LSSATLISAANEKYSSQYRGELANHLPMALVALEKMGASSSRLCDFRDNYVKRLEPRSTVFESEITKQNWKQFLGQNKYHLEYLNYFKQSLERTDLKQVLSDHLPTLFQGVAGGAFHGLIRLGYALETQNVEEIYQSLGYWAISFLDLGIRNQEAITNEKSPSEIFLALSDEFSGFRPDAPNIARRMELIGQLESFQSICRQIKVADVNYQTIAPLVLTLFAQTQDFTALHAVTSTHAYRIVSRYFGDTGTSAHCLFIALAAAYVTIRAPAIRKLSLIHHSVSWQGLMDTAVNSNDDHIPKIVFTCFEEFKEHNDPLYFEAARQYAST